MCLTPNPADNSLLPGEGVGCPVDPADAGLTAGHGGLHGVVVRGAVQVVTDVLEVLVPHDGPDGAPPLGHVLPAVLGVGVLGAGLGDQDVGLVDDALLGGEEGGGGVSPLLALLTGPVLGRGQSEHGGQADEHLVISVNTTSEMQVVSILFTFMVSQENQNCHCL